MRPVVHVIMLVLIDSGFSRYQWLNPHSFLLSSWWTFSLVFPVVLLGVYGVWLQLRQRRRLVVGDIIYSREQFADIVIEPAMRVWWYSTSHVPSWSIILTSADTRPLARQQRLFLYWLLDTSELASLQQRILTECLTKISISNSSKSHSTLKNHIPQENQKSVRVHTTSGGGSSRWKIVWVNVSKYVGSVARSARSAVAISDEGWWIDGSARIGCKRRFHTQGFQRTSTRSNLVDCAIQKFTIFCHWCSARKD